MSPAGSSPPDAGSESAPRSAGLAARCAEGVAQLCFAALAALVLIATAQPFQTDDAWWHLALGRAYASEGPWLASDPLLHTAVGAPDPAAWLFDVGLFALGKAVGFQGLRLLHAAVVAGILAAVWRLARRTGVSAAGASLATGVFVALSAYRLFQLRPELVTIAATLALYRCLLAEPRPPSAQRVVLGALLLGIWANAHSGFLLGPILLAAAIAGLCVSAALGPRELRGPDLTRARRLALGLALGLLATLVNPSGVGQHLAYFRAGTETPDLAKVADEWARLDWLHLPIPNLPPSLLAWGLAWALLVLCTGAVLHGVWRRRRPDAGAGAPTDPAVAAMAVASLAAMSLAVRFLWLAFFPILLLASAAARSGARRRAPRAAASGALAVVSLALVVGFVRLGDWRMILGTLPLSLDRYAAPFLAEKYHASAAWILADAGLEGKLYNDYFMGGFLGYWLAPRLRTFVNGSLNVPREALADATALQRRRGRGDQGFLELLDRYEVDVFVGVRMPQVPRPGRPWIYTTAHLEGAPGWIPIFRTPQDAVYLRRNERNRANLARIEAWYTREGVPFDAERGFDAGAAIAEAPAWAAAHGVAPADFATIQGDARSGDPLRSRDALDRAAALYTALGLYEHALAIDAHLLRANPEAIPPARRLVWSLLRLGRIEEAQRAARRLERAQGLPAALAAAARAADSDAEARAAQLARLPVFTPAEAQRILTGIPRAPTRAWRD